MRPLALAVAATALAVGGCDFGTLDDLAQDEAVAGTDATTEQARSLWKVYEKTDTEVKTAVATLATVIDGAGARPVQVRIEDLTPDVRGALGPPVDPSTAQGMLIITELDCSLDQLEKIAVAKNQTTIYPDLYEKYERTYATSIDAFVQHSAPTVVWTTAYTASLLGRTYEATLTGGARRVEGVAPGGGPMLLARTYLNEAAHFTKGDDSAFKQDYQIEAYYEIAPTRVIHFYGLWREFNVGSLRSDSSLYINVVLGNLVDFDVRTSKVCRDKTPEPAFQ